MAAIIAVMILPLLIADHMCDLRRGDDASRRHLEIRKIAPLLYKLVEDGLVELDDILKECIATLKLTHAAAKAALDLIRSPFGSWRA